jgi:hypothetical protein
MCPDTVRRTKLTSVPFTNIPFQQNMEFVGQAEILNRLKFFLEDSPGNRQVALYGLGGIGCVAQEFQTAFTHYTQKVASGIAICIQL